MKCMSHLAIIATVIVVLCIFYSFIQKQAFSLSLLGGIIGFLFCASGAGLFTWFGYLVTFTFFDEAFNASVKVKPYEELPVVKYAKENGFVDEKDESYETINTDEIGFVPFLTFRETIKNRFGLK